MLLLIRVDTFGLGAFLRVCGLGLWFECFACCCLMLVLMFVIITVLYSIFNFITLGCLLVLGWCALGFWGVLRWFERGFGVVSVVRFRVWILGISRFCGSFVTDRG